MLIAESQFASLIVNHLPWILAALIVVIGLLVCGAGDALRLAHDAGWKRVWAISSVCFAESIRRKVLWMVPLAIVGVIVAVQLTNPLDELDAVRQTVKYALFTSGALVVLATIILASTSLPREIENRVIYTVVTKPTTRLEIVLGKIVGFARVSGTILIIMGLFTLAYAQWRSNVLLSKAKARLETMSSTDASRPALEYYMRRGLLECNSYAQPATFNQYARLPKPGDSERWIDGGAYQGLIIPFDLPDGLFQEGDAPDANGGLRIDGWVDYAVHSKLAEAPRPAVHPTPFPGEVPDPTENAIFSLKPQARPMIQIELLNEDRFNIIAPDKMTNNGSVLLSRQHPPQLKTLATIPPSALSVFYQMPTASRRRIYLHITGVQGFEYGTSPGMIRLYSPRLKEFIESARTADNQPQWPEFHGRQLLGTEEMAGGAAGSQLPVGIFSFRNIPAISGDRYGFELRTSIEGSGPDTAEGEAPTTAIVDAVNTRTGRSVGPVSWAIESNRTLYFTFPKDVLGSDFDVHLRCVGADRFLQFHAEGPTVTGLQLVVNSQSFAANLGKSLLIMWMLSLLVVITAIFCSTFVSWPIAVVLTAVFLIAHWATIEIGEGNGAGLGASISRDLGFTDPATSKVVGGAVEGLTSALNGFAKVTPDIEQFSAIDDISKNISIDPKVLLESLKVLGAFGIGLAAAAYIILDHKEVAP